METFLRLVGEGLDASCGPQLASQKVLKEGVEDGAVGLSSDKGKCLQDSNVEFALEENCRPNSIVDYIYIYQRVSPHLND
jgi:hypothetical protein